jgi:hypothetical protein
MEILNSILRISLSRRSVVDRESQRHLAAAKATRTRLKYTGGKHAHF